MARVLSNENPFFRHAEIQLFLASREGRDVGRIAAILDRHHNEVRRERAAFFGFFESENDPVVGAMLLEAAALWARERKMGILRGPANPSLNDEAGLLVDGFDTPPVFMMTYNPPWYADLIEAAGFRKAKDLLAYWFDLRPDPLERLARLSARVRRNEPSVVVHPIRPGRLAEDLPKVREVYNEAWEANWGFVPMTPEEMDFMAARLKPLLDPELAYLAEVPRGDGSLEPIAFCLTMKDFNPALKAAGGRLWPLGWLRFLLAGRKIRTIRVITLGIKETWRLRGLQSVMFEATLRASLRKGITGCEVSWLLEDNELIIGSVKLFGGKRYKTYRIYEKLLTPSGPPSNDPGAVVGRARAPQ